MRHRSCQQPANVHEHSCTVKGALRVRSASGAYQLQKWITLSRQGYCWSLSSASSFTVCL